MTMSFRSTISIIALSTALMMGGCSGKDKGGVPQISAEAAPIGLKAPSDKVFARHFDVEKRKVANDEAENALAKLGLAESGSGDFTWADRSGAAGNYTYTNLTSTSDDGTVTIAKAELIGAHMVDGEATFDRGNFSGVTMKDDDITINVKSMTVARPTPASAKAIMDGLKDMSDDDMDIDVEDGSVFGFGAMSMDDVTIIGDEANGSIDQLVFGSDENTKLADFKVSNVNLNITDPKSNDVSVIKLGNLSGLGIRTDDMQKGFKAGRGNSGLTQVFSNMNMYQKPYDSFSLKGLSFDNANLSVNMPKYEGQAKTRGDVTTITQAGEPLVIKLKEAPAGREAQQAYDTLKQLDFDEISIRSSQTTIMDKGNDTVRLKDGIFEMKDGFKLNYTYGATGMANMQALMTDEANASLSDNKKMELAMGAIKVENMKFSLEDQSIVERGMKLAEQMSGQPRDRMLAGMKAAVMMAQFAAKTDLERDLMSEGGTALLDFVEKGGTMTIEINPDQPIAISELMELQKNKGSLKKLGFSARQDN